jgi:hypothetical protein
MKITILRYHTIYLTSTTNKILQSILLNQPANANN